MPTDTSHPNAQRIRDADAAFSRGDVAYLREAYFAPDITWHFPGRNALAGQYEGPDAVMAFFGRSMQLTQGSLHLEVEDVVANDARAIAIVRVTAAREGRTLDDRSLQLFEFRDGKVAEVWTYPGDVYAQDAFYA